MSDYRMWCRLCGALDTKEYLSENVVLIVEQFFEISSDNISICARCSDLLTQTSELINTAKGLERLFNGLMEENFSDLTIQRLNAYRAHFNLPTMISEEETLLRSESFDQDENQCYETDQMVEEALETLEYDVKIEEEQLNVEENDVHEEEVYEEDEAIIEETEESIVYQTTDYLEISNQKTEEEKFFSFICHVCEVEFPKMRLLSKHCKELHNCLPKVRCCWDLCASILSTWRRLLIHKDKHFPTSDRLHCPTCQKTYSSMTALQNHIESHNYQFICNFCGKSFKEIKTLRWHEGIHLKPLEERRKFSCPECDGKFITKQACQNHIGMKHQKAVVCTCTIADCDKSFYTKKSYYEHLKNSHGERKYFCDQCNFKSRTKQAINVHKEIHNEGKMYSCDLCSATFSVHRRLKTHMICHSNNAPFECPHCSSKFRRRKELRNHINIHTKERPFGCPFCTRSFGNAANCRKHKLKDHAEELKNWEEENGVGGRKKFECYQ